jgi:hypothetical protein
MASGQVAMASSAAGNRLARRLTGSEVFARQGAILADIGRDCRYRRDDRE